MAEWLRRQTQVLVNFVGVSSILTGCTFFLRSPQQKGRARVEPATYRAATDCSTTELTPHMLVRLSGFDHINRNAPVLIRTPKLTRFEPAQYWGGGPPGNSVVLNPFLPFFAGFFFLEVVVAFPSWFLVVWCGEKVSVFGWCSWLSRQSNTLEVASSILASNIFFLRQARLTQSVE